MKQALKTAICLFWLGALASLSACAGWDTKLNATDSEAATSAESDAQQNPAGPAESADIQPEPKPTEENTPLPDLPKDDVPPIPKLEKSASQSSELVSFWVTATFDEPVVGFDANDIVVSNGHIDSFLPGPSSYQLEVRRLSAGDVVMHIPASAASDAAGNGNIASNSLQATFPFQEIPMRAVWGVAEDDTWITLPLPQTRIEHGQERPNQYTFWVDWGDGSPMRAVTSFDDEAAKHLYARKGDYTLTIYGQMESWGYGRIDPKNPPKDESLCRLKAVLDAGAVGWKSLEYAFARCPELVGFSGGDFSQVTNMAGMFFDARKVEPKTVDWNVSNVTNMSYLFGHAWTATPKTSTWDTFNVEDMSYMFHAADSAQPDTQDWVMSKVKTTAGMFSFAHIANPNTSTWDTSNITDMSQMFDAANQADPDVSHWDVSNVVNMSRMFLHATIANPDVSKWDVSSVTNMYDLFGDTGKANPDVSHWDVSNVIDMKLMFSNTRSADPDVSQWDVSSVENIALMFLHANAADPNTYAWNPTALHEAKGIFSGSGITEKSYCLFLKMLSHQIIQKALDIRSSVPFFPCEARQNLIDNGWLIDP